MHHRFSIVLLLALALGGASCSTAPEHHFLPVAAADVAASVPAARSENIETWYYVVGEIRWPGGRAKLAYESPIAVQKAIAGAGGFSPSANRKKVQVFSRDGGHRVVDCTEGKPEDVRIQGGDYIYVPRSSKWLFW